MSDNQPPKDGGSTDELPTLPGPEPKAAATRVDAAPPARPDALSIEPVTQKKPSGTVIIQDRAKPPPGTQITDPLAATLPVGSPVGPTLPGDPQRRAQVTVLEASAGAPATLTPGAGLPGAVAPPRPANPGSGSGSMIVWAIAGGALAIGVVIGAVLYLTRSSDDDAAPEPTIALHDAGAGATAKPTTPTQTAPVPPPVTPTTPATDPVATQPKPTTPGTTQPTPTTSSSAPPPDADNNTLPRFPTSFPTAMPTAFPTVLPTAFPSSWPLPG